MLFKRKLFQIALLVALAASVVAQQEQRGASDAGPQPERLRSHVTYLASDQLEGRRTGTKGALAAAEYIAREFARHGLQRSNGRDLPGMSILEADSPRRFMQEFPFVSGVTMGRDNSMTFAPHLAQTQEEQEQQQKERAQASAKRRGMSNTPLDLRLGEDWTPLGFSSNAKLTDAPATFVGYSIKAAELNYDDYAGVDVKGRVAIALGDTPDGDNPHGQFARYADVRWKAIAAREHGAAALVVISRAENFQDDRLARLSYDNSAGDAGLPVVVISRQAAARLLGVNSLTQLAELEKDVSQRLPAPGTTQINGYKVTAGVRFNSLDNLTFSITTDVVRRSTPGVNVVGILPGSDPQLKNEAIIIGAHYDHLGRGGEGSLAPREGEIHHGADDNASGVAGLLELARIFSAQERRPRRTLIFIAFGGEEEGLIGSNFYVNHPITPLAQTVAMINMDMIGRLKANRLIIGGVGTAAEWRGWIDAANSSKAMSVTASVAGPQANVGASGMKPGSVPVVGSNSRTLASLDAPRKLELTLNEDGYGPSDHSSFYSKQVPVLFFFTGSHEDYHKPSDTADKLDYEGEARVVSLIEAIIGSIDASDKRPTYAVAKSESAGRPQGFRVTLGVVPNYAESGGGMKIDGVRDDSPAAKAGLKAGDKITKLAGRVVRNVYDYTYALGEMKAGQEYEIEVARDGQTLKLKITPATRKQ